MFHYETADNLRFSTGGSKTSWLTPNYLFNKIIIYLKGFLIANTVCWVGG